MDGSQGIASHRFSAEDMMTLDRRSLLVSGGALVGGALASGADAQIPAGIDGSKSAALFLKDDDGLAPASVDRLPLEWHQGRAKALQAHLVGERVRGSLALRPDEHHLFHGALLHDDRAALLGLPARRQARDDLVQPGPRPRPREDLVGDGVRLLLRLPARRGRVSRTRARSSRARRSTSSSGC